MVEAVKVNHNLSRLPYVSGHGLVKEPCACIWTDVNECEAKPCSQECANVYGSYQCYCRRGYQLSDIDGITCEGTAGLSCQLLLNYITSGLRFTFYFLSDIDECALPAGGHVCSYRCSNVPGSFYCTCPPTGYTLAPNGRTCQGQLVVPSSIHLVLISFKNHFLCTSCLQILMNARRGATTAPRLKAASTSREDSAVSPFLVLSTSGSQQGGKTRFRLAVVTQKRFLFLAEHNPACLGSVNTPLVWFFLSYFLTSCDDVRHDWAAIRRSWSRVFPLNLCLLPSPYFICLPVLFFSQPYKRLSIQSAFHFFPFQSLRARNLRVHAGSGILFLTAAENLLLQHQLPRQHSGPC